jgi:hypothetical protein
MTGVKNISVVKSGGQVGIMGSEKEITPWSIFGGRE